MTIWDIFRLRTHHAPSVRFFSPNNIGQTSGPPSYESMSKQYSNTHNISQCLTTFDLPPDVFYVRRTGHLNVFPFQKTKKETTTTDPTDLPLTCPLTCFTCVHRPARDLHLKCFRLALDLPHDVFYDRTTGRKTCF